MTNHAVGDLSADERTLLAKARAVAEQSYSKTGNKVGSVIRAVDGGEFVGATVALAQPAGATCAERMAIEQLMVHSTVAPVLVATVGFLVNESGALALPCGVCRYLLHKATTARGAADLEFLVGDWDNTTAVRFYLSELFPYADRVKFGELA